VEESFGSEWEYSPPFTFFFVGWLGSNQFIYSLFF
jgi:hypothetical protein